MEQYIMALDAGTTSSRCILFNHTGEICSIAQKEFTQYYPQPGWVEHDAMEIWSTQLQVAKTAMEQVNALPSQILSIGIANQRETAVVWDRRTGEPICPAIVWQCRRTAEKAKQLLEGGKKEFFMARTGLIPDAYFSATKLAWILEHVEGARARAERGELLFGTIDTWLIWKLTGGKAHKTDVSNASRTMLFNIHQLEWDQEILKLLDIPSVMLPGVCDSSGIFGETAAEFFGRPIPIAGAAGDQQAALFGQGCFQTGAVKNTYGTGCFLLMNTGKVPVGSEHGLLTTIGWKIGDEITYALEGAVYIGGASIQWLRDELCLIDSAEESEYAAKRVPDTNGCYVVPAFTGLGAPYWDQDARGTIVGLTRGCGRFHIIRATLESIAYQVNDVIEAMTQDCKEELCTLKVDGGAARNEFLMQFQADLTNTAVCLPDCVESTALGAAALAGLAVGFWTMEETEKLAGRNKIYLPGPMDREAMISGWKKAVRAARSYSGSL